MKPTIRKHDSANEYYTAERCHITELSNSEDDPLLSIARARVEPGVTTRWHRLRETTERYVILEGQGCMEVGDKKPANVMPGDVVLIPPMARQRITNTGGKDLVFLAICSPRFLQENYQDVEDQPE